MPDLKATPGPWHVEIIDEEDGEPFIYGVCSPETVCGATTVCNLLNKADAHLISAAPDLYEALERVLANIDPSTISTVMAQACFEANAALAKARGEQS